MDKGTEGCPGPTRGNSQVAANHVGWQTANSTPCRALTHICILNSIRMTNDWRSEQPMVSGWAYIAWDYFAYFLPIITTVADR